MQRLEATAGKEKQTGKGEDHSKQAPVGPAEFIDDFDRLQDATPLVGQRKEIKGKICRSTHVASEQENCPRRVREASCFSSAKRKVIKIGAWEPSQSDADILKRGKKVSLTFPPTRRVKNFDMWHRVTKD